MKPPDSYRSRARHIVAYPRPVSNKANKSRSILINKQPKFINATRHNAEIRKIIEPRSMAVEALRQWGWRAGGDLGARGVCLFGVLTLFYIFLKNVNSVTHVSSYSSSRAKIYICTSRL